MNKPDWKDAPEWSNYLAQDGSGAWYWFENQPNLGSDNGWYCTIGDCEAAYAVESFRETLEARPSC